LSDPPKKVTPKVLPHDDHGFDQSHGYGEGHGGPSGPGDVPADQTPAGPAKKVPDPSEDENPESL